MFKTCGPKSFWTFPHSSFDFVSDFEFRISAFGRVTVNITSYFPAGFSRGNPLVVCPMPEKSISQVSRAWRDQYEKGKTALERNNLDYAITILAQVLEQEPGFYECREALRATQFKKAGANTGFFKRMISGASSSPQIAKGQLALRSNPLEALKIAEQILTSDPSSSPGHKLLSAAAMAADLPKTAVLSLEILAKNSPKDKDINHDLAQAYSAAGQSQWAEEIYTELIRQYPTDPKLADELKDISARKTLREGGYDALSDGKGSYRDILKNKDQAVSMEQENRQVKSEDVASKLIQEYEARVQAEPKNFKLLRSLGELYATKKDFDKALEAYAKIVESEGAADASLLKAVAEIKLKKFDLAIEQLNPQDPGYTEQLAKLKADRMAFQLDECKQRAERYPNDLQIRYDLGVLYFEAGRIGEAISEFQKAQNNPNRKIQSLSYLGQCFAKRNMNDMAARTLQTALKEKLTFDDERKELVYALGCVLEKMGKVEEAIDQFKQIYEVDIAFKDVAAKVDAYYAAKG